MFHEDQVNYIVRCWGFRMNPNINNFQFFYKNKRTTIDRLPYSRNKKQRKFQYQGVK